MLRSALARPGLQVAVVATGLVSVLAAGTASALHLTAADGTAIAATASLDRDLTAPARADRERIVTAEGAGDPAPVETVPAAPVAPLAGLSTPDVVVRSTEAMPADLVQRLRALDGVAAAALLDAGAVDLGGAEVQLVGVDASEFRGFTPQETAASDPLWQAVARGDLAVGYSVAQERSLPLGGDVVVAGQPGRVGAIAAFGLPRTDVVVSREAARRLGAVADSVLVLAAPDLKTGALKKAVEAAAGGGVEVELLRPAEVAPSQISGKPSSWRELYIDSARYCPGLRWQILASIGQVESAHGKHLGPSSAGALGPMQFMPATWAAYGLDGDGDGVADIMNPFDAVPSAAHYLCRSGANRGEAGLYDAIFAYNRADWYVRKVLAIAEQYQ
ncbi:MAG TPA: lytic transglycosylase domain-containing protein [Mycobacteriales bacterium]|nr:lytic transglycosylase domain-containing protein [Mycobacteriales bacterium]